MARGPFVKKKPATPDKENKMTMTTQSANRDLTPRKRRELGNDAEDVLNDEDGDLEENSVRITSRPARVVPANPRGGIVLNRGVKK